MSEHNGCSENLRKTEQENMTGNYDLRVCDEARVVACLEWNRTKYTRAKTTDDYVDHVDTEAKAFYTHTQIFLLSLITKRFLFFFLLLFLDATVRYICCRLRWNGTHELRVLMEAAKEKEWSSWMRRAKDPLDACTVWNFKWCFCLPLHFKIQKQNS